MMAQGKVEVDDHVAVLQVLPFRQHVGADEHAYLIGFADSRLSLFDLGLKRQASAYGSALAPVATRHMADAGFASFARQVARRVGELGEDQHLAFAVRLRQQFVQCLPLVVISLRPMRPGWLSSSVRLWVSLRQVLGQACF
jgi:hypothetical protein